MLTKQCQPRPSTSPRVVAVLRDPADARTELARLSTVCGWGSVDVDRLEVTDTSVDPADGATLQCDHPLLALDDRVDRVHFAGTCCTGGVAAATATVGPARSVATPSTDWLVRM